MADGEDFLVKIGFQLFHVVFFHIAGHSGQEIDIVMLEASHGIVQLFQLMGIGLKIFILFGHTVVFLLTANGLIQSPEQNGDGNEGGKK